MQLISIFIFVCPRVNFPAISDKLDLRLAVDQVIINSNTDFIIDKLLIEILKEFKDDFINHLENKISECERDNKEYEPLDLVTINVPKKDFTIRPGAIPEIIDRVYYQALCNSIAANIESNLAPSDANILFSYRLNNGGRDKYMFIDSSEAYSKFISFQELLCQDTSFSCILETDVADYFQRIYHHELVNLLYGFGCDIDVVNCLASLLRKWSKGNSYGIPQSMWPSYLFGNAYLHELDFEMSLNENYKYVRYVDDIRVFCESTTKAKLALMNICNTIRHLGLSVQPAKTYIHDRGAFCSRIKPFSEKINELIENRKVTIEFDWYFNEFVEIEVPSDEAFISGVDGIFEEATHKLPFDEIAIKFCLNAYAYNRQATAVRFCLKIYLSYRIFHLIL